MRALFVSIALQLIGCSRPDIPALPNSSPNSESQEKIPQESEAVAEQELCSPVVEKVKVTEQECLASEMCLIYGHCSPLEDECVALKDEDCARSTYCKESGSCVAKEGKCVATLEVHCQRSRLCKEIGHCSLSNSFCLALKDEDCEQSDLCKQNKHHCKLNSGTCFGRGPHHNCAHGRHKQERQVIKIEFNDY